MREYKLRIYVYTGGYISGEEKCTTIYAENNVDALLQVFLQYNLQNSRYFNPTCKDSELTTEELEDKQRVIEIAGMGEVVNYDDEIAEADALYILNNMYYEDFDASGPWDIIISLKDTNDNLVFCGL